MEKRQEQRAIIVMLLLRVRAEEKESKTKGKVASASVRLHIAKPRDWSLILAICEEIKKKVYNTLGHGCSHHEGGATERKRWMTNKREHKKRVLSLREMKIKLQHSKTPSQRALRANNPVHLSQGCGKCQVVFQRGSDYTCQLILQCYALYCTWARIIEFGNRVFFFPRPLFVMCHVLLTNRWCLTD